MNTAFGLGFGFFFLLFFALAIGNIVAWVLALVEVVRLPDYQFRAAGTEKVSWILIVVLAGGIGALVWYFAKRRQVLACAGMLPPSPPGWYPEVTTGAMRWWDGMRWVDARQMAQPQPYPPPTQNPPYPTGGQPPRF